MIQMILRNVKAARLVALAVLTVIATGLADGQTQRVKVDIPYSFTVASKKLPAGEYTFSINDLILMVQSGSNAWARSMILTPLSGPPAFLQGGSLVFDKTNKGRVLSELWLPSGAGVLVHSVPKGHDRDVLTFSELSQSAKASGKTAFNLTCAHCHGKDGRGNADADKFFKITIPQLASAEVQAKSDAELKEIIAEGTATMPPVEVEESGFRHRLPPQDVDAVIAYVRTLKQ